MRGHALIFACLATALLLAPIGAAAGQNHYHVVIPGVLSYPTTTLTFSSPTFLGHSLPGTPQHVHATFSDPNWAATVSDIDWKTTGKGTYVRFTCQTSSAACLRATGGKGFYTYSLLPSTDLAPAKRGNYSLTWYVFPPGGYHDDDRVQVVPEPDTFVLLGAGLLGFLLFARRMRKPSPVPEV
jgi:PEP-CTERM motif